MTKRGPAQGRSSAPHAEPGLRPEPASSAAVIRGSCLCGAVRLEIRARARDFVHCHCSQCRKAHGAAFGSYVAVPAAALRIVAGADRLRAFRSSAPVLRSFCGECGSRLTYVSQAHPQDVWVAAGILDGDPGLQPRSHIHVASKAPWYEPSDGLPRLQAGLSGTDA